VLKECLEFLQGLATVDNERSANPDAFPSDIVSVPSGRSLVSLEPFQARPNRIKHKATLLSTTSFADYLNRFKVTNTSVYVNIFSEKPSLTAVMDHHGPGEPSWGGHVATFAPKFSMEWLAWKGLHAQEEFTQHELVAFIEDHANDLLEPTPAKMLTAVKTFEAVETHTYKSAMNLDNGNMEIEYMKDGGQRKIAFPHTVTLRIPIIENEQPAEVAGRFRYRTGNGRIAFTFQLKKEPARVERDALREIADLVKKVAKGAHFYEGATA
jgi:uncharacterized protein YfdQ (DUF2303 family)